MGIDKKSGSALAKSGALNPRQRISSAAPKNSRSGRPALRRGGRFTEARREEVIRKAALLFIERGYKDVTIDHIVAEVGGSKATVYARFGGKADLFSTVIEEYCQMISHELKMEFELAGTIEDQLVSIGRRFLALILRRQTLELHRLMVSIGDKFPRPARIFFQAGPAGAYQLMAEWIERQQAVNLLAAGDADELARLYLDMLTGNYQLARLLSVKGKPSEQSIRRTAELAAAIFLRGAAAPA